MKDNKMVSERTLLNIKKFMRNKLAVAGLFVTVLYVLLTVCAPLLTNAGPAQINMGQMTLEPGAGHIFGTDKLGRELWSRVLYGGQMSILIGVSAALMGSVIGMVLGSVAGYLGGKTDTILVRLSETFQTFPSMILILILVSLIGPGVGNLIFIFSITGWMTTFRMIRNEFLTLREETYVQVCVAFGMSKSRIMFQQILPNTISPIIVATTVNVAGFILQEAGLSYLGLGVPSSVCTWGNILNASKSLDIIANYWWLWLIPGIVISLFVLAINFLGDGLRDVLDPKQQ